MKDKRKIIIILLVIVIIILSSLIFIPKNNNNPNSLNPDNTSNSKLVKYISSLNKKKKSDYKKISALDFLNESSCFSKYAFINNNSIYIFDPNKLDEGEFIYKKVYDIDDNIKVMNIRPTNGADIKFFDYNDTLYTLHDENLDNKVRDSYDMYLNANYKLSNYLKWEYSTKFLGKKIKYDFMSNYAYLSNNKLYRILYQDTKYPSFSEIKGSYNNEKVIRIYNERIVKTDKSFYEMMTYFDTNSNKTETAMVRIKSLTKYYDEVLTFTYKYVILKDLTIIPINDLMENRVRDYSYDYFLSGFNYMNEVRYEE